MAESKKTEEFSWNDELRKINDEISGNQSESAENAEDDLEWIEDLKDLNTGLEERILEANKDKTKVKWNRLLPDLMGAEILMVGQFSDTVDVSGNKMLNILMMQKDGHTIIPFFTNPSKINAFMHNKSGQLDVMKVNTVRFFQSIKGTPCILNPMSDYSRIFTPFEMKILAAENIDKAPPLAAERHDENS